MRHRTPLPVRRNAGEVQRRDHGSFAARRALPPPPSRHQRRLLAEHDDMRRHRYYTREAEEEIRTAGDITGIPSRTGTGGLGRVGTGHSSNAQTLNFLSPESTHTPSLLETQASVLITGLDDWTWVAYGFVDTYFDDDDDSISSATFMGSC